MESIRGFFSWLNWFAHGAAGESHVIDLRNSHKQDHYMFRLGNPYKPL